MPKMKTWKLKVLEQPVRSPKTPDEVEKNKNLKPLKMSQDMVTARNIDAARKRVREILEKDMERVVRSVSVGPEGIFAVVYGPDEKKSSHRISRNRLYGRKKRR